MINQTTDKIILFGGNQTRNLS